MTKLNKIKADHLKATILFIPLIFYGPFIFSLEVYPQIRISLLLLLSFYLFFKQTRYFKNDVLCFFVLLLLSIIMMLGNKTGLLGIYTTGNYLLTMFFGWGLFRYFSASSDRAETLIGLYVKFFYLVSICSILSILHLNIFGELHLFDINTNSYNYKVTPFGLLLEKNFGFITIHRSFFYFIEPLYVGFFYAANIFFIAPYVKVNSRLFIMFNVVGGWLTYSYTFYALLIILYIIKNIKNHLLNVIILIIFLLALFYLTLTDILIHSSLEDRLVRLHLFAKSMENANISELFFGYGVRAVQGNHVGFSSGIAIAIFEIGIIGAFLQLLMVYRLRPSLTIFSFFILTSVICDPIKLPIFWFLLIITSCTSLQWPIPYALGWSKRLSGR